MVRCGRPPVRWGEIDDKFEFKLLNRKIGWLRTL
jgi:hypothetical protein